jgi:hypothetical protein
MNKNTDMTNKLLRRRGGAYNLFKIFLFPRAILLQKEVEKRGERI